MIHSWAPHFSHPDITQLEEKVVFSGYSTVKQFHFQIPLFEGGKSKPLSREVLCRPDAVAVLLYDPESDQVVFIEQFRIGAIEEKTSPWLLEIVAGLVEAGDPLEETAIRETKEETGCDILSLIPICSYLVSPGISTERVFVYCGKVKAPKTSEIHGLTEEGEDIKVHVMSSEQAFQLLVMGQIVSSPTIIAVQWLQIHHSDLHFPQ